ncbi:MAG: hypothetical protein ACYCW6_20790 [Candidatus Xenobia bacterium]
MANNEIQGIGAAGARGNVSPGVAQTNTSGMHGSGHAGPSTPPAINTHDVTHFSPDVDELSGGTAAAGAQSGVGVPGMHAGQTITSGGLSNATPGVSNAGVIISGRAPENALVTGSAGKIY